jgi:hypothetical protein
MSNNQIYEQVKKMKVSEFKRFVDGAICDAEIDALRVKFVEYSRDNGWRFGDWLEAWTSFVASMPVEGEEDEISN